jgi:type IV secretory pathway TrbD component
MKPQPERFSAADRIAALLIGTLFVACGIGVLYLVPRGEVAGLACGAVLLLLGLEALVAAARRRPPLLSRIGPLP